MTIRRPYGNPSPPTPALQCLPRPTRGKRLRSLEAVGRFLARVGVIDGHTSIWRDATGREEIVAHFVPPPGLSLSRLNTFLLAHNSPFSCVPMPALPQASDGSGVDPSKLAPPTNGHAGNSSGKRPGGSAQFSAARALDVVTMSSLEQEEQEQQQQQQPSRSPPSAAALFHAARIGSANQAMRDHQNTGGGALVPLQARSNRPLGGLERRPSAGHHPGNEAGGVVAEKPWLKQGQGNVHTFVNGSGERQQRAAMATASPGNGSSAFYGAQLLRQQFAARDAYVTAGSQGAVLGNGGAPSRRNGNTSQSNGSGGGNLARMIKGDREEVGPPRQLPLPLQARRGVSASAAGRPSTLEDDGGFSPARLRADGLRPVGRNLEVNVAGGVGGNTSEVARVYTAWREQAVTVQGPWHANEDRWVCVGDLATLLQTLSASEAGGAASLLAPGFRHPVPKHLQRMAAPGVQPEVLGNPVLGKTSLWCVFDGHGGSTASEYCRTHVVLEVMRALRSQPGGISGAQDALPSDSAASLTAALKLSIAALEAGFSKFARRGDDSGCCATLVLCRQGVMVSANLGDCRAMLFNARSNSAEGGSVIEIGSNPLGAKSQQRGFGGSRGHRDALNWANSMSSGDGAGEHEDSLPPLVACYELTTPHRADDPPERARIESCGGSVVNGRVMGVLEPSRAIGDLDLKRLPKARLAVSIEPSLASLELVPGAAPSSSAPEAFPFVVLASDGLWDFVEPRRVYEVAKQALMDSSSSQGALLGANGAAAKRLAREAEACGSQDDITVMVVTFQQCVNAVGREV